MAPASQSSRDAQGVVLAGSALQYIKKQLESPKTLAKYLSEVIGSRHGTVVTVVPPDVPTAVLGAFTRGGITTYARGFDARNALIDCIDRFLRETPRGCCTIADEFAQPGDPALRARKSVPYFFENEVYFTLFSGAAMRDAVANLIRETMTPNFFAVLSDQCLNEAEAQATGTEINDADLLRRARNVRCLVVAAYDGEGFLYWRPS